MKMVSGVLYIIYVPLVIFFSQQQASIIGCSVWILRNCELLVDCWVDDLCHLFDKQQVVTW